MGTRSSVHVVCEDGIIRSVYGHWDGYPDDGGVGEMLANHYSTQEKAEELVNLGDFSSLRKHICPQTKEGNHTWDSPIDDVSVFYGRDRGEDWEGVQPTKSSTLAESLEANCQQYNYKWEAGRWYCKEDQEWNK